MAAAAVGRHAPRRGRAARADPARRAGGAAVRSWTATMRVFVRTRDRLVRLERDGRAWTAEPVLEGAGDRVPAGARRRAALLTSDDGAAIAATAAS